MKKYVVLLFFYLILLPLNATKTTALFSPADKPTKKIIELLNSAKKSIHAAIYMFTDKTIAEALEQIKKNKKIDIKLIIDPISTDSRYSKADFLAENNIDLYVFDQNKKNQNRDLLSNKNWFAPIMHNKFVIIDGILVCTGSFNWTVSANTINYENIIITDDRETCKKYEDTFASILPLCNKYVAQSSKNLPLSSLRLKIEQILASSPDDAVLYERLIVALE